VELIAATIESLRKYVLRAKVRIEDASALFPVAGAFGAGALETLGLPAAIDRYAESSSIGVARLASGDDRYVVIGERPGMPAPRPDAAFEQAWRLADIHAGRPQIYAATRELFVAQMLNLDRLDAISFSKGCYTGQEIIARTQHLGRIKRRMFRLKLPAGHWSVGQSLTLRDGRSGRIVETAASANGAEALAVLTLAKSGADTDAEISQGLVPAIDAQELPLPYSLE
jgi:folate-binding protein YgfZ